MSMTDAPDDDDLDACESCGKRMPYEDGVLMCDCTFCKDCYEDWLKTFQACQHEWEVSSDPVFCDPGRYCRKCSGFVADEDTVA